MQPSYGKFYRIQMIAYVFSSTLDVLGADLVK